MDQSRGARARGNVPAPLGYSLAASALALFPDSCRPSDRGSKEGAPTWIQQQVNGVSAENRPATLGLLGGLIECLCRVLRLVARSRKPLFFPREEVGVLTDLKEVACQKMREVTYGGSPYTEKNQSSADSRKGA